MILGLENGDLEKKSFPASMLIRGLKKDVHPLVTEKLYQFKFTISLRLSQ